jgi:hypothetical protein
MKIKDIHKLYLLDKTKQQLEINIADAIGLDEFYNPIATSDYREKAVLRLVNTGLDFVSNANLIHNCMKKFVQVKCPKCMDLTEVSQGGGGDLWSLQYRCGPCKCVVTLTLPNNGFGLRYDK